jgi:hypothetical protein
VNPDAFLEEGARLMSPKLEPLGFGFQLTRTASGSGGAFAEGAFSRGDRQLIIWARFDVLHGVRYSIGSETFDHETYMTALGKRDAAQYPGFPSADRFGGFRRLLADLELCGDFFDGDSSRLLRLVAAAPQPPEGFAALSS